MTSIKVRNDPMIYKYIGVLPYAINPITHERVYLLGRERDALLFGSFGGTPEPTDTSIYHTAARECYEESMGFLGSQDEIYKILKVTNTAYTEPNSAITFLMEVKYDANLPRLYHNVYQYTTSSSLLPSVNAQSTGYYEKDEIGWFTRSDILRSKSIMRPTFYNFFTKSVCDSGLPEGRRVERTEGRVDKREDRR